MKFEEQFPSLKGKHFLHDTDIAPEFNCYSDSCIMENCLDKAKVMEVIDNVFKAYQGDKTQAKHLIDYIKKELGL